jgi:hypothetical protein
VTVARDAGVEDGNDVGVVKLRDDLHLALEAFACCALSVRAFPQHFDGDRATRRLLQRLVDDPLPAAVDLLEVGVAVDRDLPVDLVAADLAFRLRLLQLDRELRLASVLGRALRFFLHPGSFPDGLRCFLELVVE